LDQRLGEYFCQQMPAQAVFGFVLVLKTTTPSVQK